MLTINNNYSAAIALQNLNVTNRELEKTQTRLNTGQKVASAKDDAAFYGIAEMQRGEISGLIAVQGALSNGESILDVAMAAGQQISSLLNEMYKKAIAATDETLSTDQRAALSNDYVSLRDQIENIVANAEFNGRSLIQNASTAINVLVNTDGGAITVSAQDLSATGLGVLSNDLTNLANASAAVSATDVAIVTLASRLGSLGASSRSINTQQIFVKALTDSLNNSVSNIVDADLAEESARLQALQIKQQLGVQALSIANQAPQAILSLFRS